MKRYRVNVRETTLQPREKKMGGIKSGAEQHDVCNRDSRYVKHKHVKYNVQDKGNERLNRRSVR